MTTNATAASVQRSNDLGWLTTEWVRKTPGAAHAVVVSADGLKLAASDRLEKHSADQVAAIASGLSSLTVGAAKCFQAGKVIQTVIQMEEGYLFLVSISDGACLAVLAAPDADLEQVTYGMTMLADQVGPQLTPQQRAQLNGDQQSNSNS
jgi:predicted regulator of Ras-like GTPase activity (Roadblock/LC7/MglB family)